MTNYDWVREVKIVDQFYSKDAQKEVNKLLKEGWKLLEITQCGMTKEGISTYYTLGR